MPSEALRQAMEAYFGLPNLRPGDTLQCWNRERWVTADALPCENYRLYRIVGSVGGYRCAYGIKPSPTTEEPESFTHRIQVFSPSSQKWVPSIYRSMREVVENAPLNRHYLYRALYSNGTVEYAPGYDRGNYGLRASELTRQRVEVVLPSQIVEGCYCNECLSVFRLMEGFELRQLLLQDDSATSNTSHTTEVNQVTMPTSNSSSVAPPSPPVAPVAAPTSPNSLLVDVSITRNKQNSNLELVVNAKSLHDHLDQMGVRHSDAVYLSQPESSRVLTGSGLSTSPFLRREYPVRIDLTGVFTSPPTRNRLVTLSRTAHDAIRRILEHYQPVDIKVSIHKRITE